MTDEIRQHKNALRNQVWSLLDQHHVLAEPGSAHGRIPNFRGAADAAERLADLSEWQSANTVKAVPDKAQAPARVRALRDGKRLYMAVPKLADEAPFRLLDPATLPVPPVQAAAHRVATTVGVPVELAQMAPLDFIVCGSVAVTRHGARLGKGAGYSDIEVALLIEAGLVGPNTTIVTTVHPLQVIEQEIPEARHDFSVDYVLTHDEVIACGDRRRPTGLDWQRLAAAQIAAIPVLQQVQQHHSPIRRADGTDQ